jgi:hypothetical protein
MSRCPIAETLTDAFMVAFRDVIEVESQVGSVFARLSESVALKTAREKQESAKASYIHHVKEHG